MGWKDSRGQDGEVGAVEGPWKGEKSGRSAGNAGSAFGGDRGEWGVRYVARGCMEFARGCRGGEGEKGWSGGAKGAGEGEIGGGRVQGQTEEDRSRGGRTVPRGGERGGERSVGSVDKRSEEGRGG